MLTENRQQKILNMLGCKGSVTVTELMTKLDASESTVRRDINSLAKQGLLKKVWGGAVSVSGRIFSLTDDDVSSRKELFTEEKRRIAEFAAGFIKDNDFVYIDAGTTTLYIADYITAKNAVFVTNAIEHARALSSKGFTCLLPGGEFKLSTEALVGEETLHSLSKYNFTKGFFGTNAITIKNGCTTPDIREALIKKCALKLSETAYVLADHSKFDKITPVSFAEPDEVTIITDALPPAPYRNLSNIITVTE